MKTITKVSISIITITISFMFLTNGLPEAKSHSAGAAAGKTNSPADGSTCNSCHTGTTAPLIAGMITSTIPGTGYVPGTTYTITGTITRQGHTKFGFEISPQNVAGTLLGSLVNTSTGTQIVGVKYVTHTTSGTAGTNTKSWSFDWVAPVAGTGNVTFYGAFNATNSNNMSSGDSIYTSTLTVAEHSTTIGIDDLATINNNISVFPNPFTEKINILNSNSPYEKMNVTICDLQGKIVLKEENVASNYLDVNSLSIGYYILKVETPTGITTRKLFKK